MLCTMGYFNGTYVVLLVLWVLPVVALRSNVCLHDGKKFLIVMPNIHPASDSKTHHLVIQGRPGVSVKVMMPWNATFKEKIPEDGQMTFHPNHKRLNANFTDNAVQKVALIISSSLVINVFVYSEDVDGYVAIQMPIGILRRHLRHHYVIASYKVGDGCKAFIAVAAISDRTLVNGTVRIKDGGKALYGSQKLKNGASFTNIQLGTLDVLYIWSENDLTGSAISSSTYVSVFSGFDCTCRTDEADLHFHGIMTQIPSSLYLRHQYLPVPAFGVANDTIFRIIAIEPNTTIHKRSSKTFRTTLSLVGDFVDMHSATQSPGVIRGDKPILVMSYLERNEAASGCLSAMTLVSPGIQFEKIISVYAIPSFETSILIIHKVSPSNRYPILINDTILDTLESFEVDLKYMALRAEIGPGSHVIASANSSSLVNVYVYGKGRRDLYSFIGACVGAEEDEDGDDDDEDEEEEEEEEEVSASSTKKALELSTRLVEIPAASSLQHGSGNYIRASPDPSATLVSLSDPLTPPGGTVTSISLDPATILASSGASATSEFSEHSDKLAPSKTSDSLLHSRPTNIPASSDHGGTLVPVHVDPTATLVPVDPTATLVAVDPNTTLVSLVPSATTQPFHPGTTLELSDASSTLETSESSSTLETSDASSTLEPSDRSATIVNSDPASLLIPLNPSATLVFSEHITFAPSDPSAALVLSDPVTLSSPRRLCPCPGTSTKQAGSVHQSALALTKSKLTLYTKNLSSQIRKRISSYDGRTSSKAFGYTGMVLVFVPLLIVFVCDARLFLLHIAGKT